MVGERGLPLFAGSKHSRREDKMATKTAKKANRARNTKHSRESELRRIQAHPKPPMPKQHQDFPGIEARVHPRPQYLAPLYKGADKLKGKVALISGGDSGIGRAVAGGFSPSGAESATM